jgi:hypothetical protein
MSVGSIRLDFSIGTVSVYLLWIINNHPELVTGQSIVLSDLFFFQAVRALFLIV